MKTKNVKFSKLSSGDIFAMIAILLVVIAAAYFVPKLFEIDHLKQESERLGPRVVVTDEDAQKVLGELSTHIIRARKLRESKFAFVSKKAEDAFLRLLDQRRILFFQRGMPWHSAKDAKEMAILYQQREDLEKYIHYTVCESEALQEAGYWEEAVNVCTELLRKVDTNASPEPYRQLLRLHSEKPEVKKFHPVEIVFFEAQYQTLTANRE